MKHKLFYGWYIVIAGLVISAYYSALAVYGFTAFIDPIVATFGWTYAVVLLATSMRGMETGVFNALWGAVVDRWSSKKLMLFSTISTGLGIVCVSQARNLAMYFIGFFIMGLGASLFMGILPSAVFAKWFRRNVGKANGLFFMGMGIGGLLVPIVAGLIDSYGWQNTLMFGAFGFWVIGIPLSLVFRSRPENYGLLPDGKTAKTGDGVKRTSRYDFGTSVREVLKTRSYWHLCMTTIFQNAALGTVVFCTMPYFTSLGVNRTIGSTIVMLLTLASLCTRMPLGMLTDVFRKSHVIALSVAFQGAGMLIFWSLTGDSPFWLMALFALTYGLGTGGIMSTRPPILMEYFGARNIGPIMGVDGLFHMAASMISMPVAGWVFDTYHDYKPYWLVLIILGILALAAILTIPKPQRRPEVA